MSTTATDQIPEGESFIPFSPELEGTTPIYTETIFPGLQPEALESRVEIMQPKALVLITNGNGTVPSSLSESVGKFSDEGIVVIALPDRQNPFPDRDVDFFGVNRLADEPQQAYVDSGGIFLEKAGYESYYEVVNALIAALNAGLEGNDLRDHMVDQFSFDEGEETRPGYGHAEIATMWRRMEAELQADGNDLTDAARASLEEAEALAELEESAE
jgi:hypothetical protein